MTLDRREFLKLAGATSLGAGLASCAPARWAGSPRPGSPDVVVIGAGAFGGWTALHLRRMGARVTLVDMWGPGNSRATSGDETRGVRSSYGDRLTWVRCANQAMARWANWDQEWGSSLRMHLFFTTGDLILRPDCSDPWLTTTRQSWDNLGVRYEVLAIDEVA